MGQPAHILVVEDEPRLRSLLRLYLEWEGHKVTDVGDGRSALAAYEADGADLVVLDLMLPAMQGETVLEALREHGDVPILITSAKRTDAERIAGLRMGADDYLAKPFNPHELTARVAAILRRVAPSKPVAEEILSLGGGRLVLDPVSRRYALSGGESSKASRDSKATCRWLSYITKTGMARDIPKDCGRRKCPSPRASFTSPMPMTR